MFVVTSRPITELFVDCTETAYFAFKSDAENYAKKRAAETDEVQKIYIVEEESKFLPPEITTWEVTFTRSETRTIKIKAQELHQAIQKARKFYPENEWDLIRSHQMAKEELL